MTSESGNFSGNHVRNHVLLEGSAAEAPFPPKKCKSQEATREDSIKGTSEKGISQCIFTTTSPAPS